MDRLLDIPERLGNAERRIVTAVTGSVAAIVAGVVAALLAPAIVSGDSAASPFVRFLGDDGDPAMPPRGAAAPASPGRHRVGVGGSWGLFAALPPG